MNLHVADRRDRSHLGVVTAMVVVLASFVFAAAPAVARAADYDPLNIMSDDNFRDISSMSQGDVQGFLDAQPGVLKSYSAPEFGSHGGAIKPASQIIWEAAQANKINPRVILATLEKEQSLLSQPWHAATATHTYGTDYHLTNAMGAGVYPTSTDRHPGFGDQVWTGARVLSNYITTKSWYPGKSIKVTYAGQQIYIVPANYPTFAFYTYTPYYPQKNIWTIYVRYFGDPLAPVYPPGTVFRFFNWRKGSHFYTANDAERNYVATTLADYYRFEGVAYSVNTSNTANSAPLYRFYNRLTGTHFYTASEGEKDDVRARMSSTYLFENVAYRVSLTPDGAMPVYRFFNIRNGTHFYTSNVAERDQVIQRLGGTYHYEGPTFWVAP